jgi:hypothetical protein
VIGCDGVVYANTCDAAVNGHQSEAPYPASFPHCGRPPEGCGIPVGSNAECEAYWYCNNAAPVSCRTLPNGLQQVVCGQDP